MRRSAGTRGAARARARLLALALPIAVAVAAFPAPLGARGAAGTASLVRVSGPIGGWCWFADPRAVYDHGRTYVGWVDGGGYVVVGTLRKGKVTSTRIGQPGPAGFRDDHDNPAILVEPDGRITAFYSHHNGPAMYWRRTLHPRDTKSWGPERVLANNTRHQNTYPNPIWLASESKTYLFFRGDREPTFSRRGPNGHWSSARTLAHAGYLKVASNDRDTIGLAFTDGHPREAVTSIYYARYRAGMISHADGRPIDSIKSLPFTPADADKVYDAQQNGGRHAWIHDLALSPSGKPVMTFATFSADGESHRYEYARWNGHRWITHHIVDAGGPITGDFVERWYSGGVVLDHGDPRIVYASVQRGSQHEIERFVTRDGGRTWQRTPITSQSSTGNVRPFVPRNLPKESRQLLWMRGFYNRYQNFETAIVASP